MYKVVSVSVLGFLLLCSCTPTKLINQTTLTSTRIIRTATQTSTRTITPTETPVIPKNMTYKVQVNCITDKTIDVELKLTGDFGSQVSLAFNRGGFYWKYKDQKDLFINYVEALDPSGSFPQYSESKDQLNNTEFIFPYNHDSLIIRYSVKVGFWDENSDIFSGGTQIGGFVGQDYCVIEPAILFMTPQNLINVDRIQVSFSLPPNWDVVTFWDRENDYFIGKPSFLYMSEGPFGFGKFASKEENINNTKVVVAAANGVNQPETQLEKALDLYEYLQSNVYGIREEYIFDGSPRNGYIAVFIPSQNHFYNLYHAEYGLYMSLLNQGWDNFAHMASHNWTMDLERAGAPWYVTEGFVEYLQESITLSKGYISNERYKEHFLYKFNEYKKIIGTQKDLDFINAPTDSNIQYNKGALFALLLDDSLKKITDGQIDLQDLMKELYKQSSNTRLDTRNIEIITSELAGYDFSGFFEDYVYGIKELPLKLDNLGYVVVDIEVFDIMK